jgi:hypothetical protein
MDEDDEVIIKVKKAKPTKKETTDKKSKPDKKKKTVDSFDMNIRERERKANSGDEDLEERGNKSRELREAMNNYFKLKDAYESEHKKNKAKILKLTDLSWKEKRLEMQKLKQKCINCKRPVGSIFSIQILEDDRHLIAMCGDRREPCPLNININLASIHNILDELNDTDINLNKYKKSIIKDKNDLLFGYITQEDAIENFDKIKDDVDYSTKMQGFFILEHAKVADNETRKKEIEELKVEFYRYLDIYNQILEEYRTTQQTKLIQDAVTQYVNNIHPRAVQIRNKTYSYNGIERDESENITILSQLSVTREDLEWNLSIKEPDVVSLVQGLEGFKKKKSEKAPTIATAAIPDIKKKENTPKTKTAKKPKFVIEEEYSDEEQKGGDGDYSIKEEFGMPDYGIAPGVKINLDNNSTWTFESDPDERKGGYGGDDDDDDDDDDDEPLDKINISGEDISETDLVFDSLETL